MQPDERPEHDTATQEANLASHLSGDGHKTVDSSIVTFLVITLGLLTAWGLALLVLTP